jgi:GPH family glycoside/pentoside/hexuronide:cation symporter
MGPLGLGLWLVVPSMQADVADYDEMMGGSRREGSFSAVFSWTFKAAAALTGALSGILLTLTGFRIEAGAAQSPQVLENLKLCYIWLPVIFLLICLFAISRYPLTRSRMRDIRARLEERRGMI